MSDRDDPTDAFAAGMEMRKQVLGADHVERSLAQVTDFSRPVQEFVTEFCWGGIWTREGLSLKTRSLLNLVMLTALNRSHELGIHVGGALRNGATILEIQETLLQTAVYVGAPAALEAFRVAEKAVADYEAQQ
jgi:4-carboxymuconolactone decarboxylase